MALTDLWNKSRDQLNDKRVGQVIAFAGSGKLNDDGETSKEFREFLRLVPSDWLGRYAEDCLTDAFQDSGLALQDIVNQMGRRLGFDVTDGKYRGAKGRSGHDGIWRLKDGHAIIVEVKTTDAYRIDLNVLAGYRSKLIADNTISSEHSSILIVVGRQDTDDLEAQIRGSRHAWDIRLISIKAMMRLMGLKEAVEDPKTIARIHKILVPEEFTRLDGIVDIVFSAAEEVKQPEPEPEASFSQAAGGRPDDGPRLPQVNFHKACVERLERHLKTTLVKQSRANYVAPNNTIRMTCAISKNHGPVGEESYWFAFHLHYQEFLAHAKCGYVAFGCGSEQQLFVIPYEDFFPWLEGFSRTENETQIYWHVRIYREDLKWKIKRRQGVGDIDITRYLIPSRASKKDAKTL